MNSVCSCPCANSLRLTIDCVGSMCYEIGRFLLDCNGFTYIIEWFSLSHTTVECKNTCECATRNMKESDDQRVRSSGCPKRNL